MEYMFDIVSNMLGEKLISIKYVGGGGNSRVYKLTNANGDFYALKDYLSDLDDAEKRMEKEFVNLEYLFSNGIHVIPKPLYKNEDNCVAIYSWLSGEKINTPDESDINNLVKFLGMLHKVRNKTGAEFLPRATESCFSASDVINQIDLRLEKLSSINDVVLLNFLENNFLPLYQTTTLNSKSLYKSNGMQFDDEITCDVATLSTSDFGFHNALRTKSELNILDLEYFGWDDPVKVISDFIWHPGMKMKDDLRRFFFKKSLILYNDDELLNIRLRALFPLYGLRWSLIMLNEFLPEKWERRMKAKQKQNDEWDSIKKNQLVKAINTLEQVNKRYEQIFI